MKKILVVDDDMIVANIYTNLFRHKGCEVQSEGDGQVALSTISTFRPDAILLDLQLPTVSGVEVIKRVRAQAHLQHLPIIVFSNAYQHNAIEQAFKAGATHCLVKARTPPEQVVNAVMKTLIPVPASPARPVVQPLIPAPLANRADPHLLAEIVRAFSRQTAELLISVRQLWQEFLTKSDPLERASRLDILHRKIHTLTGNAVVADCLQMADLSSALEALMKELCDQPQNINLSTLRTVGLTMDLLGFLLEKVEQPKLAQATVPRVLVVDDEPVSLNTAELALELVHVKPTTCSSGTYALAMLVANPFDLILLDVDMPGMSGFEVCGRLRAMPAHKNTPVIFITGMNSFENRAQSTLTGGNDLIGKPFLLIELAVKALTYLIRGPLQNAGKASLARVPEILVQRSAPLQVVNSGPAMPIAV